MTNNTLTEDNIMGFLKKIFTRKKPSELDQLKQREYDHDEKSYDPNYYFSEEAAKTGKQIYKDKKEYVKNNPTDFETVGAEIHGFLWSAVKDMPASEREIFYLTGEGKYYEDLGEYQKAIEKYQDADDLTMEVCGEEIQQIINDSGPGDYLYTSKIRQRIRVCERKLKKQRG